MTHNNNPAGSGYGVPRPFTFDRVVRILFSIAALLAAVWLIDILKSVLLPFLIAWLVAYLPEPEVPTTAANSPFSTVRSTPSRARTSVSPEP